MSDEQTKQPPCNQCGGSGLTDEVGGVRDPRGPAPCETCEPFAYGLWLRSLSDADDDAICDLVRRAHGQQPTHGD